MIWSVIIHQTFNIFFRYRSKKKKKFKLLWLLNSHPLTFFIISLPDNFSQIIVILTKSNPQHCLIFIFILRLLMWITSSCQQLSNAIGLLKVWSYVSDLIINCIWSSYCTIIFFVSKHQFSFSLLFRACLLPAHLFDAAEARPI